VEVSDACSRILAGLMMERTGQQLAGNRRWRIETALKGLMNEHGFADLEQLVGSLAGGTRPALAEAVTEALLNNETFFFRDRLPFDLLLKGALRRIEQVRQAERRLSIWCAGCSTGQEAYSLAMSFAEDQRRWAGWTIDILATDISGAAIEQARSGLYSQFEVQRGLSVMQMLRWFEEVEGKQWRIAPELRRAVRFQRHSLLDPPPGRGRFDVVLCRNVLLYFPPVTSRAALARLAEASAPGAALMLGAGETVMSLSDDFLPDLEHRGLYVRAAPAARSAA
jgi:chemotaxis protein methyltransferase CheR